MVRGERTPVPIRDMERERRAEASSEVKTYTLPPEEIERIFGGKKPERPSMPGFDPSRRRPSTLPDVSSEKQRERALKQYAEQRAKSNPEELTKETFLRRIAARETISGIERACGMKLNTLHYWVKKWNLIGINPGKARGLLGMENQNKEDDAMNLTKEQYLAERIAGSNRTKIQKTYFPNNPPKFYAQLGEWGIKEMSAEEAAIKIRLRLIPAETAAEQPSSSASAADRAKLITKPKPPAPPDADLFAGVEWFSTETIRTEAPSVSLSKKGLCFDGLTSKRLGLNPGDGLMIGYAPGRLILRRDESGLKMQRSGTTGIKLMSERLLKWPKWTAIVKRKYELKQADGAFYVEVEVQA